MISWEDPVLAVTRYRRPGPRRTVPRHVPARATPDQVRLLKELLFQGEQWISRSSWNGWLHDGAAHRSVPISRMTNDQLIAATSWLRQQRHDLHRVIEGTRRAPDGWLEATPLYVAMQRALPGQLRGASRAHGTL